MRVLVDLYRTELEGQDAGEDTLARNKRELGAGPSAQDAIMMQRESLQHDKERGVYRVVYRRKRPGCL